MKIHSLISPFALVLLTACASVQPETSPSSVSNGTSGETDARGTLVLYRNSSLQAVLADAYIGTEQGYFTQLGQNEYTSLDLEPGALALRTRAQGSVAGRKTLNIVAGAMTCVEVRPNHEELPVLLVPFVNALVPVFVLEETPCPELDKLQRLEA